MAFWSFGMISFFCEIGERLTTEFEHFDRELSTCDWYLLPIDLQRTLLTVMMYSQKPASIQGYANTPCTRYALSKVFMKFEIIFLKGKLKKVFSCFHLIFCSFQHFRPFKEVSLFSWHFDKWPINFSHFLQIIYSKIGQELSFNNWPVTTWFWLFSDIFLTFLFIWDYLVERTNL